MKLPISVVIPTLNRPETLKQTLDSFIQCNPLPEQIIVIDQSIDEKISKDILDMVLSYKTSYNVIYHHSDIPSLTKARNISVDLCTHDIIVFSDDDVTVRSNVFGELYSLMHDTDVSMVAGLDLNMTANDSPLGYIFAKKIYKKRGMGHVTPSVLGRFPAKTFSGVVPTEWAMGFFFAVKKSLIQKWNIRWDETLKGYAFSEDLDFSFSYYKKSVEEGMRCVMSDTVAVYHNKSKEWRVTPEKFTKMYVINRMYLSYKHHMGLKSRFAMRWCNTGLFFERLIHKDAPFDVIKAQWLCDINRNKIKSGLLDEIYS